MAHRKHKPDTGPYPIDTRKPGPNPQRVRYWWDKLRREGNSRMSVGQSALGDWEDAHTLADWDRWEYLGLVEIEAIPEEENYWDVFGEPDSEKERKQTQHYLDLWGCYWVVARYRLDPEDEWEDADSIGMNVYENPLDPQQNCYVVDLMRSALDKLNDLLDAESAKMWADSPESLSAGSCAAD